MKDTEKRQAYDDLGKRPASEQFTPPPDRPHRFNAHGDGFDNVDLADLFAAFGRGRHSEHQRHDVPMSGQDYEVRASITFGQWGHRAHRSAGAAVSFELAHVVTVKTARRLRDDFQLESLGLALALTLLRRADELEAQLRDLQARL